MIAFKTALTLPPPFPEMVFFSLNGEREFIDPEGKHEYYLLVIAFKFRRGKMNLWSDREPGRQMLRRVLWGLKCGTTSSRGLGLTP